MSALPLITMFPDPGPRRGGRGQGRSLCSKHGGPVPCRHAAAPRELSGALPPAGQMWRRALAMDPENALLDEPTVGAGMP